MLHDGIRRKIWQAGQRQTSPPSVLSFSVCLIAFFFVACACRGGAKRRHLYQDKHTPRLQIGFSGRRIKDILPNNCFVKIEMYAQLFFYLANRKNFIYINISIDFFNVFVYDNYEVV